MADLASDAAGMAEEQIIAGNAPDTPVTPPAAGRMPIPGVPGDNGHDISFLNDVEVTMTVELGRTAMPIREVLKLKHGAVVELDKLVGQPADLLVNNTLMARGEVVVINERFGFRITKFIKPTEMVHS